MMRNPVFESSAKRRMRSFRAPLLITMYTLFVLLVSTSAFSVLGQSEVSIANMRVGVECYIYLSAIQFALIVLVSPSLTAGSISGERERQTLDILLCSRVGPFRIVLGKLFSSVCFIALLIVSSMPMMGVMLLFGGIRLYDVAMMLLLLVLTAFACGSIGIFCSAVFKRTVTATVVSYLIIFAVGLLTVIIPLITTIQAYANLPYDAIESTTAAVPALFYLNPGIGFLSMLVRQTGMLSDTFYDLFSSFGSTIYQMMQAMERFEVWNMAVFTGTSLVLALSATFFIKPSGRKAKKK